MVNRILKWWKEVSYNKIKGPASPVNKNQARIEKAAPMGDAE